jgi:type VI secretion system secreted protein VgrG
MQVTAASGGIGGNSTYLNEFDCIPSDDVFRPERRTPWPAIFGFLNAKVDAAGAGDYAEIDDQGRYKVKLPFDMSDKKDGKASRFIRMAQPYAGANMGMHFPLHKNTEVLLSFVDGDVDRPIIASAVPNAESAPPVTSGNQSQCAIHTGGGNKLVIEDTAGNERIKLSTPHSKTVFQLGAPNTPGTGAVLTTDASFQITTAADWIRTTGKLSKNDIKGDNYNLTQGKTYNATKGNTENYTDGNSTTVTKGSSQTRTEGNADTVTIGNATSDTHGNSTSKVVGDTDSTFIGTSISKNLASTTELFAGNKNSACAAVTADVFVGLKMSNTNAISVEANTGGKLTICDATDIKTANMRLAEATADNEIKGGKITIDSMGDLTLDALSSITLKCGGSEIKLSSAEITIKSTSIKLDASGSLEGKAGGTYKVQGAMLEVNGQAMHK